jgi:capsular exopolysaccharide synthesis family protein
MSRIDQALKRAAHQGGHSVADRTAPSLASEPPAHQIDQSALEGYAAEKRRAESDVPRERPSAVPGVRKAVHRQIASFAPWLQGKLVVSRDLNPISSEQYRRLGATLHGLQRERGVKTLMVSSAVSQEGKTLTVTNLALTLSDSYNRRVLLIDADLRRPAVHEAFGLSNATGLADVIRDGAEHLPLIEVSPHLVVLTAGRINTVAPMAELTSDRLPALIKQVSSHFDWVLLDTPPTGVLPDARLVARVADAILFVIGAGVAPYDLVQRAIAELGDRVIGTVLNRVDERSLIGSDYYRAYCAAPILPDGASR